MIEVVEASRLSRRQRRTNRESQGEFIHLSNLEGLPTPSITRKLLHMILLLGLKDRASEIHIEPGETETGEKKLRLRYVIEGESYDLVPPPGFLAPVLSEDSSTSPGCDLHAVALAIAGEANRWTAAWPDIREIPGRQRQSCE